MIKILFFIPKLSEGGAEKVLRNLVNNMNQSKFDITVQTIDEEKSEKYLNKGIHYKAINRCKTRMGKKIFSYWFRFCAEFKLAYPLYIKDDYDIEVAYLECGATKIIASSTNKKALKLAWVHCDLKKKDGFLDTVSKSKKYYKTYDRVICVSEDTRKSFVELFDDKPETVVLYNVNDEEEIVRKATAFEVPKEDAHCIRLVSVGRLTYQKGYDRLIEVCKILKESGYFFELLILGEGPERKTLESLIVQYQLEKEVKLLGFVDNPYPYINSANIAVCSSRYEGFSTFITESAILGKAIVTTSCTGMKEILGDSEYGVITDDSINGLYEALGELMTSPEKIKTLSKLASDRGELFSKKKVINETQKYFEETLKVRQKNKN